jgi:uncharacterized membrane-anchored protein
MNRQSFFYNFTASRVNGYSKFNFGIITADSKDDKSLADKILNKLQSNAKEEYPDADDINVTAFNRV